MNEQTILRGDVGYVGELPRVGELFADYRLEEVIGRGGMSVVYRAENLRLGNQVALKLMAPELAGDQTFRERFERESRLAASINHPSIVPIHDAGEEAGMLYIVMRYVVGNDLSQLLREGGPLGAERCLAIITQVASALDAAHGRALVHRDVKPANILVEQQAARYALEHAYLSDFGLTKHTASTSGLTRTGHFVGTIDYMAPEQIADRPVDGRADVYALGCVLYQCLSGKVPFDRETQAAKLWSHLTEAPPQVTAVVDGLPTRVDDVIARALAKSPQQRHQTAGDLVVDLREALGARPSTAPATARLVIPADEEIGSDHSQQAAQPVRLFAPPRRRRVAKALAALSVIALLAGGGAIGGAALSGDGAAAPISATPDPASEPEPAAPEPADASTDEAAPKPSSGMDEPDGSADGEADSGHGSGEMDEADAGDTPEGLAAVIPAPIFEHCDLSPTLPPMAVEAVDCMPPSRADRLRVATYESRSDAVMAYEAIAERTGIESDSSRCSATAWDAEATWSHGAHGDGSSDGRVVCYFTDGASHIAWIVHDSKLVATATIQGHDHGDLFRWWHFWHHQFV